jgi:hypothetical protein
MAVPTSGTLSMLNIAQEALYGTWGSGTITGPISIYDMINGGNSNGSGNSYPTVNDGCTPNPVTRTAVQLKQVYKKANTVTTGPFTHYFSSGQASNASSITGSTILYSDSALTTPVGEFGTGSNLFYWYQDASGLSNTDRICGYNYNGDWDTTASSTVTNSYCGQ